MLNLNKLSIKVDRNTFNAVFMILIAALKIVRYIQRDKRKPLGTNFELKVTQSNISIFKRSIC